MKQKHRRKIAALLMIILLLSSFRMITFADTPLIHPSIHEEIAAETPGSLGAGEDTVMPLDITFGNIVTGSVTVASTVYYAPHPNVSASTGYTLTPGGGFYCLGREYDYYYIYWYVGTKEMFGYIPVVNTNLTSSWDYIEYDIFRPATCSATTPVLSYAGTTNTYMSVGEIYAGESPLMVLGKQVNPYNNRTYYFVQYQTSAGLTKRGWVDIETGGIATVSTLATASHHSVNYSTSYFSFINEFSKKALTWDSVNDCLIQADFTGATNQTFKLEKVYYNGLDSGYYKILPSEYPSLAVTVNSTGYAEGLSLLVNSKATPDKRQEFRIDLNVETIEGVNTYTYAILSRSTGEFRAIEVHSGNGSIIQSKYLYNKNQQWSVRQVQAPFGGFYEQNNGPTSPNNYQVHVDDSITSMFTVSNVQHCLNRWSDVHSGLNSTAVAAPAIENAQNRLALLIEGITSSVTVAGETKFKVLQNNELVDATNRNGNIYTTVIEIYPDNIDHLSRSAHLKILTHEFGHAFKLTHTYREYEDYNGSPGWIEKTQSITLMDQGEFAPGYPTDMDTFRILNKWSSIS